MSETNSDAPSGDEGLSNPAEEYSSNQGSEQQASLQYSEDVDDDDNIYQPRSPDFEPPASPSEEASSEPFPRRVRQYADSGDENPQSPDFENQGPESPEPEQSDDEGEEKEDEEPAKEEDDDEEEPDKEEHDVGDIIADIFGEDEADEEFKGFKEAEERVSSDESDNEVVHRSKVRFAEKGQDEDSKTSDEVVSFSRPGFSFVGESDFDKLLNKRREEQRRRRQRSRGMRSGAKLINVSSLDAEERDAIEAGVEDLVQDGDDIALQLVNKMIKAAKDDGELFTKGELACKKLMLLDEAISLISNVDFQPSMFDNGILGALTDWLLPLPDNSLPNIKIRSELLRLIQQFPPLNSDQLKDSGLGKAIMILGKHPKEIRANRAIARKLINEWSRGIFGLSRQASLEERERLDKQRMEERKRRLSSLGAGTSSSEPSQPAAKRPGDPGWIYRARVPQLSGKDYVVRPEWQITDAPKSSRKEPISRYEKHARNLKDKAASGRKRYTAPSFVKFSIEGRKVL